MAAKLLQKGVIAALKDFSKNGPKRIAQVSCLLMGVPMDEALKLSFQIIEVEEKLGVAP